MKVLRSLKPALAGLMCLGLVVPQAVSAGLLPTPQNGQSKISGSKNSRHRSDERWNASRSHREQTGRPCRW